MDISIKLKQLRHEKGLTQKELADKTGLSLPAIINYENSLRSPNAKAMAALEQFFGVTAAELLSSNGKPPLKAIVRRIKKNPPKPTSSGKDILFVTKVNRYGITRGSTCWYFPELAMYVGSTVSIHRDGSVRYKDKHIGFIDL